MYGWCPIPMTFTVPGAIVFEYVQRLLVNALFYGKFTSNESRSITLHESDTTTQACQYGSGWLRVYALNTHIQINIIIIRLTTTDVRCSEFELCTVKI